jgi:hypothetical protein
MQSNCTAPLELIHDAAEVRLGLDTADLILADAEQPLAAFSAAELRQIRGGLVELADEVPESIDPALALIDTELDRDAG